MSWLLFLLFPSIMGEIVRYDVASVWNRTLIPTTGSLPIRKNLTAFTANQRGKFVVQFECSASPLKCDKAKQSIQKAADRLTAVVQLNTNVNVLMTFRSFCVPANSCSEANTIGQAGVASYFSGKLSDRDPYLLFPQGLVKQLKTNENLDFSPFDILADFNADVNYHFSDDNAVESDQVDLEFVVIHELTHGLGFQSGWIQWSSIYPSLNIPSNLLAPGLTFLTRNNIISSTSQVSAWQYLSIFDLNIISLNGTIQKPVENVDKLYKFNSNGGTFAGFVSKFLNSGEPVSMARSIYQTMISSGLQMKLSNNETLQLYTTRVYQSGSSVSHVDLTTYGNTPEFLMVPSASMFVGQTLDMLIQKVTNNQTQSMFGPYGPKTLRLLTDMGNCLFIDYF
jgi:hypothetical protein